MNYARIYDKFIADRKAKGQPESYSERHHILPRSLGGGDDAENLVDLTPSDHFFAHLLLAKIHGGVLLYPLALMARLSFRNGNFSTREASRMRRRYALARILLSREGSSKFNPALFDWVNVDDGRTEQLCLYDMHKKHGGSRPSWTAAASGDRKTYRGWTVQGREIKVRGLKGRPTLLIHEDGRTFYGTQSEFCAMTGLSVAAACRVARGDGVTKCGWRLASSEPRQFNGCRAGIARGSKPKTITLRKGDTVISGGRIEIAKQLSSTPAQISASVYWLKANKSKTYKGWSLVA